MRLSKTESHFRLFFVMTFECGVDTINSNFIHLVWRDHQTHKKSFDKEIIINFTQ